MNAQEVGVVICVPLVILFLVGALVGVIVVFVFAPKSLDGVLYPCNTPECLAFKTHLMSLLTPDVKPCEDFYRHVCDKWLQNTGPTSFIQYTIREFHRKVNVSLLQENDQRPDKHGMHILSWLYRACYHFMTTSTSSLEHIVAYTRDALNISSIISSEDSDDLVTYLIRASLLMGFHTVYGLRFEYKEKKIYLHLTARTSIVGSVEEIIREVSQDGRKYSVHRKSHIQDVVKVLYEGNDTDDQIWQLTQWDDTFHTLLQNGSKEEYRPIASLQSIFAPLSVEQFIATVNSMVPPNLAIGVEGNILVYGFESIQEVIMKMRDGSPLSRALYFSAYLVTKVARFFYLHRLATGDEDAAISACLRITRGSLFHTWPYLITRKMKYGARAHSTKVVADRIRESVRDSAAIRWMSDSNLRGVRSDLSQLSFEVYEEATLADANYTYEHFTPTERGFLPSYFEIKKFESNVLLRWVPTEVSFALSAHQMTSDLSLQSFRLGALRWIFIPSAYQSPPLFQYQGHDALPFYINFPTVGVLAAREMIRAIGPSRKWDKRTNKTYWEYGSCLQKVQTSLGLKPQRKADDWLWMVESFSWSFGFRLAYEAMRSAFQSEGQSSHEAQELFFILFCRMACSAEQPEHPITPKEQCMIALHSSVDFLSYYKCSPNTEGVNLTCVSSLFTRSSEQDTPPLVRSIAGP